VKKNFLISFIAVTLILSSFLLLNKNIFAAPNTNPIFATIAYVHEKIDELFNQLGPRIQQNESDIGFLRDLAGRNELKIFELEGRIEFLESLLTPTPTPISDPLQIVFAENRPASFETDFIPISDGYKSMTFNVSTTDFLINWAPAIEIDGISYEQHRFRCSGVLVCPEVTIPILSDAYQFRTGTSGGNITAIATLNTEPNSQVLILGKKVNYPFISIPFSTDGFSSILITAGGGDNPQNLAGISLQRFEGESWVEKEHLNCDGGAECPLQELPVLGGEYRVVLQGSGTGAVLGALIRK